MHVIEFFTFFHIECENTCFSPPPLFLVHWSMYWPLEKNVWLYKNWQGISALSCLRGYGRIRLYALKMADFRHAPSTLSHESGWNLLPYWMHENTREHLTVAFFLRTGLCCVLTYGNYCKYKVFLLSEAIYGIKKTMWNYTSLSITYVKCDTLLCCEC